MTKLQDNICALRDLIAKKEYSKLVYKKRLIQDVFKEIHRNMVRKVDDYGYQLDFTSQDLRELAQDIRGMFKSWSDGINPEKNIKQLAKLVDKTGKLNFAPYTEKTTEIMRWRRDNMQVLIELLNLIEYHAVFLYYTEIASNDEFALNFTERIKGA